MKQIFGCLLLLSASSLAEGLPPALQVPGEGRMFNGWSVTPAGKAAALPGDMPLKMIVAPDGRVAVTVCAGYHNPGVGVLDLATNNTRKFHELSHTWNGLAFDKAAGTTGHTSNSRDQIFAGYGLPPGGGGEGKDAGGTVVYVSPDITYDPHQNCGPCEVWAPKLDEVFTSSGFATGPETFTYNGQQMWRLSVVITTTRKYILWKYAEA